MMSITREIWQIVIPDNQHSHAMIRIILRIIQVGKGEQFESHRYPDAPIHTQVITAVPIVTLHVVLLPPPLLIPSNIHFIISSAVCFPQVNIVSSLLVWHLFRRLLYLAPSYNIFEGAFCLVGLLLLIWVSLPVPCGQKRHLPRRLLLLNSITTTTDLSVLYVCLETPLLKHIAPLNYFNRLNCDY